MPIYEYRCKKGHTFEVRQSFSDDPVGQCEVCGVAVQRVFHPIAVHFKGSGFYNTDYGTRKRSKEMKEHKEGVKTEAAKGDGAKSDGVKSETSSSSSSSSSSKDSGSSSSSESNGSKSDSGAKKAESKAASSS